MRIQRYTDMAKRRLTRLLVASHAMISACASPARFPFSLMQPPAVSVPVPVVQFSDVPVPSGFAFVKEESFQFENEAVRVGLLRYLGSQSIEEVAAFYRAGMPNRGWDLVNELAHDRHILSFEKPSATCTVTVENVLVNTRLSVAIAPHSQGRPKEKSLDKH